MSTEDNGCQAPAEETGEASSPPASAPQAGLGADDLRDLVEALEFYADRDTYHAIKFLPDPPCGPFIDDFDKDHGDDFYNRPMPGVFARRVLRTFYEEENLSEGRSAPATDEASHAQIREAVIEECAKIADKKEQEYREAAQAEKETSFPEALRYLDHADAAMHVAEDIRTLKDKT